MPAPICIPCGKEMKLRTMGRFAEVRGQVWSGDEYHCGDCGTSVLASFGKEATSYKAETIEAKRPGALVKTQGVHG